MERVRDKCSRDVLVLDGDVPLWKAWRAVSAYGDVEFVVRLSDSRFALCSKEKLRLLSCVNGGNALNLHEIVEPQTRWISGDESLVEAFEKMRFEGIPALIVKDEAGEFLGIIRNQNAIKAKIIKDA
ncbi:MAG: CBS domain-containing protein [Bdellovibrionales bacterium]|nr:CBS domain-containing protein [Bdellovibrionales bacterium]